MQSSTEIRNSLTRLHMTEDFGLTGTDVYHRTYRAHERRDHYLYKHAYCHGTKTLRGTKAVPFSNPP